MAIGLISSYSFVSCKFIEKIEEIKFQMERMHDEIF